MKHTDSFYFCVIRNWINIVIIIRDWFKIWETWNSLEYFGAMINYLLQNVCVHRSKGDLPKGHPQYHPKMSQLFRWRSGDFLECQSLITMVYVYNLLHTLPRLMMTLSNGMISLARVRLILVDLSAVNTPLLYTKELFS